MMRALINQSSVCVYVPQLWILGFDAVLLACALTHTLPSHHCSCTGLHTTILLAAV
jgi:hypothetical protein